jgi:4-diphosphocytidyl-2-C-methyl-D-erythritol kinase
MSAAAVPADPADRRRWPAPAKLNLFLHVTGQRSDGFHNLQTIFQLLDWGDELEIALTPDSAIERLAGPEGLAPAEDLTVRAALLLQSVCQVRQGAQIRLRKRIPMGGGLGGGSSDAATVLQVLNKLWGTGLTVSELATLGLQLGSDVPVFVQGRSAWAEGRGEVLTPIELPPAWYLIVWPRIAVSTAGIFQAPELTRNSPLIKIRALSQGEWRNDCESLVLSRYPGIAAAIDWVRAWAPARLSGTGSCVFASFASAREAERVAARVPDEWASFVARGVNQSPLVSALASIT